MAVALELGSIELEFEHPSFFLSTEDRTPKDGWQNIAVLLQSRPGQESKKDLTDTSDPSHAIYKIGAIMPVEWN
jgi:hypothetical protein